VLLKNGNKLIVRHIHNVTYNPAELPRTVPPASPYGCGIIWSPDGGKIWAQYDLKEFGARSGCRINRKNSDGWFRMDLRKGWIERAEVLFLKPTR